MISSFLSGDLVYAISWTIVHSLWQISLICLLLFLFLRATPKLKSNHRYIVSYASLAVIILMSLVTFCSYYFDPVSVSYLGQFLDPEIKASTVESSMPIQMGWTDYIEYYTPLIVNVWIIGALLFALKIAGGYIYIKNLISSAIPMDTNLNKTINKLRKKYNISRTVQIKSSNKINTPMVMGYIKPIILFPVGLVNQLTVSEVESILAHELAHVKRHDFLLNLFQMVAEAIFYYHPGIWYISSRINAERENCCDDLAISMTGNNISYAKTLIKLQDLRLSGNYKPALAYSGNKNTFTYRIMRILNQTKAGHQYRDKFLALFLVFASLILGANNWESNSPEVNSPDIYFIDDCPSDTEQIKYYLDTIPEKNTFHIKKLTDEKDVEMEMENGEITRLTIDGKVIPTEEYEKHKDLVKELSPRKGKDFITIFPECDKDVGNVYIFRDTDKELVNIDSILNSVDKKKVEIIKNYWTSEDDIDFHEIESIIIDTLEEGVIAKKFPRHRMRKSIVIDSVFDLMPDKMPRVMFFPDIEEEMEDIIIELENDIVLDFDNDMEAEDIIIRLKKELDDEMHFDVKKLKESINEKELRFELRELREKAREDARDRKERIEIHRNFGREPHVFRHHENEFIFGEPKVNNVSEALASRLLEDQLIDDDEKSKIELSSKYLKINGDKQPENIWKKYLKIYEEFSGLSLEKGSKMKFEIDPKDYNTRVHQVYKMRI